MIWTILGARSNQDCGYNIIYHEVKVLSWNSQPCVVLLFVIFIFISVPWSFYFKNICMHICVYLYMSLDTDRKGRGRTTIVYACVPPYRTHRTHSQDNRRWARSRGICCLLYGIHSWWICEQLWYIQAQGTRHRFLLTRFLSYSNFVSYICSLCKGEQETRWRHISKDSWNQPFVTLYHLYKSLLNNAFSELFIYIIFDFIILPACSGIKFTRKKLLSCNYWPLIIHEFWQCLNFYDYRWTYLKIFQYLCVHNINVYLGCIKKTDKFYFFKWS